MAVYENAVWESVVAGATFSTADLHKWVVLNATGHAVLPNTTGNVLPYGILDSVTGTTSAAGSEAVAVVTDGVAPLRMAASTLSAGDFVGSSTVGLGIAPSSDGYTAGIIKYGSSGALNRRVSVRIVRGPLNAP